jgi:hypothetical protein
MFLALHNGIVAAVGLDDLRAYRAQLKTFDTCNTTPN